MSDSADSLDASPLKPIAGGVVPSAGVTESVTVSGGRLVGSKAQAGRASRTGKTTPVITFPRQLWLSLCCMFILFVGIGAVYFWGVSSGQDSPWLPPLMTILWLLAGGGVLTLLYWMWSEFVLFGDQLSEWANLLRQGDLSARMQTSRRGCPSILIREQINAITDDYQAVARMQQQRLDRQEAFIAQKNHHLSVLYEVASCINRSDTLEELFERFLGKLQDLFKAEAMAIRLLDGNGELKTVASIGLGDELRSGKAEVLTIPLQYREKTLGRYELFVSPEQFAHLEDEHELLTSIGQHLGMAIEKAGVDEEARLLSIMEERTRMAHELHDSLAQTLASLRFKVRLFDDSLHRRADQAVIWQELEGLENTIDEAYAELRSLITHFRAPFDGKGVVRNIERITERFRQETGLDVFFYHNWSLAELDDSIELEVIRIVQEALANVRKHSQAKTVRILMYSSEEGRCSILVEDDGIGLPDDLPAPDEITGEHIGIHVMQERAEKIGGEVQFESDPDEGGTLMQLSFAAPPARKPSDLVGRQSPTI